MAGKIAPEEKALKKLLFPKLKKYWNTFQKNVKRVKNNANPDAVHDLRVSIRRLRSVVAIFKEFPVPLKTKSFKRETKKLMEILGQLRDLHVQYNLLKKSIKGKNGFLKPYLTMLEKDIERKEDVFEDRVKKAKIVYTPKLVKKILSLKTLPPPPLSTYEKLAATHLSNHVTRCILQKYLMLCFSYFPLVEKKENRIEFHRLRVQIKKLRYKLEILHPLLNSDFPKEGIKTLRKIQDAMGATHDIDVVCEQVRKFYEQTEPKALKNKNFIKWFSGMRNKRTRLYKKSLGLLKEIRGYNFIPSIFQ